MVSEFISQTIVSVQSLILIGGGALCFPFKKQNELAIKKYTNNISAYFMIVENYDTLSIA